MVARHLGKSVSYLFAAASALLITALAGAALLLALGPLRLDFLKDELAQALAAQVPGYRVSVDGARLVWDGRQRDLAVQLDGVRFVEADGRSTVSMPRMAIDLDRRRLLGGELRPTGIAVAGPSITLRRTSEGRLSLQPSPEEAADDWRVLAAGLIEAGDSLRHIEVRGASLRVVDEVTGGRLTVPQVDLRLTRLSDGIGLEMSGGIDLKARRVPVAASGVYRGPDGESAVTIRFAGLRPSDVVSELSMYALAPVGEIDLPVSGTVDLRLGSDGVLRQADYALRAGAGTVAWGMLPQPAAVVEAAAAGSIDVAAGRISIASLRLALADGAAVEGAGEVLLTEAGVGGEATARLTGLTVGALASYWPEAFAAGARRWITANVERGVITTAELTFAAAPGDLAASPPPADLVQVSFEFADVTARYWQPLPPLVDGRGRAWLNTDRFELTLVGGRAGGLDLDAGTVQIDGLSGVGQVAAIEVAVAGPAAKALALLDREPLRFATELGLPPDQVAGSARVNAGFTVPLRARLALADITYDASARLSGFAMPSIFGRYAMSDGEIDLDVDGSGIGAEGVVRLNGLPVSLSWRRDFGVVEDGGEPAYPDRYGLAAAADVADFRAIGLDLTGLARGPVSTDVQLWVADDGAMEAQGEVDLAAAEMASPLLRWRKPAAAPAQARFRIRAAADGRIAVDEVALTAGTDLVVASAKLDAEGRLRQVQVPTLRLAGQDLAAELVWPEGGGPVAVALHGRLLDARPFLDDAGDEASGGVSAELSIDVDRLQLGEQTALAAAEGDLSVAAGALGQVRLSGRLNGSAPLGLRIATAADHRDLVLTSADAGGVLRALSVLEDAEGGALRVRARMPRDGGAIEGRLFARDVRVRRAPLLARVLSLGSISGIQDTFAGDGMTLRHVELPFVLTPARLSVVDGRAIGPDLGMTLAGSLDRAAETLDLTGTLVPTYTLNRLLGKIPILGNILIGRKGEGVFAVTYHIAGPATDPTVSVNPLSALAPGILRRLVEGLMPAGAAAGPEEFAPAERDRSNLR